MRHKARESYEGYINKKVRHRPLFKAEYGVCTDKAFNLMKEIVDGTTKDPSSKLITKRHGTSCQ